jgi:hypothetical protein
MNWFILDIAAKPVNPLLGSLDESFGWDASIKLRRSAGRNDFQHVLSPSTGCILLSYQGNLVE